MMVSYGSGLGRFASARMPLECVPDQRLEELDVLGPPLRVSGLGRPTLMRAKRPK